MLYGIALVLILLIDQLTKAIADFSGVHVTLIEKVLSLDITMNSGAAWGMFADKEWGQFFFAVVTSVALVAIVVFFIVDKKDSTWLNLSITFITAGALGNMIDRIVFSAVRDFINLQIFNCNVADIAITAGGIMFVVYFLFLDENALFRSKGKKQ